VFALTILVMVTVCALLFGGSHGWQDVSWRLGLNIAAFDAAPLATRIHAIFILAIVVTGWGMLLELGRRDDIDGDHVDDRPARQQLDLGLFGGGSALVLMAWGIMKVKRRRYRDHARTMVMLMIALIIMSLLAIMPGRLMHDVLFSG
jgi:hypothetical protein